MRDIAYAYGLVGLQEIRWRYPPHLLFGYQVFVNGQLMGGAGDFSGSTPVPYTVQPKMWAVPRSPGVITGATGSVVIAFRVWMAPTL